MALAIARHYILLDEAIVRNGGVRSDRSPVPFPGSTQATPDFGGSRTIYQRPDPRSRPDQAVWDTEAKLGTSPLASSSLWPC